MTFFYFEHVFKLPFFSANDRNTPVALVDTLFISFYISVCYALAQSCCVEDINKIYCFRMCHFALRLKNSVC